MLSGAPHGSSMASIGCQVGEIGKMAARCVLKNVYDVEDIKIQNTFEPHLVLRESVKKIQ